MGAGWGSFRFNRFQMGWMSVVIMGCAHTGTRVRTRACALTPSPARASTQTCTRMHTCVHARPARSCARAHGNTQARARSHARACTHAHARMRARTPARRCARWRARMHERMRARVYAHVQARAHACAHVFMCARRARKHACANACGRRRARAHANAYAGAPSHTRMNAHARAFARTNVHMCTRTYACVFLQCPHSCFRGSQQPPAPEQPTENSAEPKKVFFYIYFVPPRMPHL